jgi:hypothetical protein
LDDLRKNQNAIAKKFNDPIRKFTESVRKNEIPVSSLPKNNIILSEEIFIESSADCKIVIKSNDALKKAGFDIAVKKEESKWIAFHTVTAALRTHKKEIGEFTLEKHNLSFKFDHKLVREDAAMLNAFLETAIIVSHTKGDKDKVTCRLGNPDIKPLLRPEFEFKVAVGVQLLEKSLSENNSKFELDCEIFGLPEDYEPKTNRKFKLSFPAGNNDGSKTFERKFTILKETVSGINIKVSLEADKDNGLVVHCKQILDLMVRKSKYVSEYKSDDFKVEPFTKEMEYVKKHRGPAAKKHSDATKLFGQIEAAHNKDPTDKKKQNAYDAAQNELNELKDDVDRLTGYLDYLNSVEEMRKKLVGEDINGNKKLDALEDGTMVNGVKVMNRKIDPGSIYITYKLRRIGGKDNSKQAIIVTSGGP